MAVLVGVGMGIPFGLALYKSGMANPTKIKQQMHLDDFTMMKTFLSASVTGTAAIAAGHMLLGWQLVPKALYPNANIVGGLLLGCGMTLSGACPGTVCAQSGAGRRSLRRAIPVIVGGLTGTTAYALLHDTIRSTDFFGTGGQPELLSSRMGWTWGQTALGISAACAAALVVVETRISPTTKASQPAASLREALSRDWNPYLSGALIGALQAPAFMLAGTALGTSSAYVTVMAHVVDIFSGGSIRSSYFSKHMSGQKAFWQVGLDMGIVAGAYFGYKYFSAQAEESSQISDAAEAADAEEDEEVHNAEQQMQDFVGGFLLLFGARLADGCTSGHGLSGVSQGATSSLLTTAAMFAGGMGSAWLLNQLRKLRLN